MKIVVIDKKVTSLEVSGKVLHVEGRKIPLHLIDTLIIATHLSVETKALLALGRSGIFVICIDSRQNALLIHSHQAHNGDLKLSQYKAATDPLPVAKVILTEKIMRHIRQIALHDTLLDSETVLHKIEQAEDIAALLGIEGAFSRDYFGRYFALFPPSLRPRSRSRQPPLDPVNAMLSYYYTLFYHLIAVRLYAFGFEPSIGFLHKPFRSHFALASDVLEPFRAVINEEVYRLFETQYISAKDFSKKGKGVYLRYEKRAELWREFRTFYAANEAEIERVIQKIRGML